MIQYPSGLEPKMAIPSELQPVVGRPSRRANNDAFEKLVQELKDALGPSSGLTSDDVDVEHLTRLMEEYDPADKGWRTYFFGDKGRNYTRNLVDEGNGKSNLVGIPTHTQPRATTQLTRALACARLVPGQVKPHPRPRERSLPDEDSPRGLDRDSIRVPQRGQ